MSIPALRALRERFPQAHIAIVARPGIAGLYAREPFCDELFVLGGSGGWKGSSRLIETAAKLRGRVFDCAILLQNAFEAAALVRLAGIPTRIGYNRDARGWLLTQAVPVPRAGETAPHERFYYLELLRRAGIIDSYSSGEAIRLAGAEEAARHGRKRFADLEIQLPVIGVSPGAAYGGAKRWLPERFAEAAAQISSTTGASVAIFGAASEHPVCQTVHQHLLSLGQRAFNLAGATSLPGFIEMAAACSVFLTNDSGPMHIASALSIPTVAVFGPTDESATGPTGPLSRVVREPVSCSPCLLRECPIDHRCMLGVTSQRVASTALNALENNTVSIRNAN